MPAELIERTSLRDRTDVFSDRDHAGRELAALVREHGLPAAHVLAVPAGGVPVAAAIARELGASLDVAVVSKITLPWNTEAGYGAVAFDGSTLLNDALIVECGLTPRQVEQGIVATRQKVQRRAARLRAGRGPLSLTGRAVLLVDDGLASGFTMRAAVAAVRSAGAARVIVAVPTGHARAVDRLREVADVVVCANVRGGVTYAVADAYQRWSDVPEVEAELVLERTGSEANEIEAG
jgi:predicted phosphoribosyltransferase